MGNMRTLEAMQSKPITTAAIRRTHPKSHIRRFKYAMNCYEINQLLKVDPMIHINGELEEVYVLQAVDFERGESIVIEFMKKNDYFVALGKEEL